MTIREIVVFAMLGALMTVFDILMNVIPNVHFGAVLIVTFTAVYRWKALFPVYVYVCLIGLMEGFGTWWLAYLYIWPLLWAMAMLIPRRTPAWLATILYSLVCGLHGFCFGLLWIPSQMLLLNYTMDQAMMVWAAGFITADVPHGVGNLAGSTLILPLVKLIRKLDRGIRAR